MTTLILPTTAPSELPFAITSCPESGKAPTSPGIFLNLPHHVYHNDKNALSSTGARRIRAVTPRQFYWEWRNPTSPDRDNLELGQAFHTEVLGVGPEVVVFDAADWRSKTLQAQRRAVRQQGKVPLLTAKAELVSAMAEAVHDHPVFGDLLATGFPEVTVYWIDPSTGVLLRARIDWVHIRDDGTVILIDLKSTISAMPADFRISIADYQYDCQQDWYQRGLYAHGIRTAYLIAAVSKAPPHEVGPYEIDPRVLVTASNRNTEAIGLWNAYRRSGEWPGLDPAIQTLRPPPRRRTRTGKAS